jgi:O-antigen/teichoic acid export membrane protein
MALALYRPGCAFGGIARTSTSTRHRYHFLIASGPAFGQTARKLFELALTHLATFAFPLVFAVVCGRTLGISEYGVVSFYAALAGFLGVLVEFGFDWYGTRAVAQNLGDRPQCHRVLWNITATKLLLCTAVLLPVGIALWLWRGPGEWVMRAAAAVYLIGFAFDASWYVRALERTRTLLLITTCVRLIGIGGLLIVVTRLGTKESALWTYAAVSVLTSGLTWWFLVRKQLASRSRFEPTYAMELMRHSGAIVLGNLNGALMTNGGIALLGVLADPATVGAANLALRVRMASQAVMLPLQQLGFVRLSATARSDPLASVRLGRRLLVPTVLASLAIALTCIFGADLISSYVFKAEAPVASMLIVLLAFSGLIQSVANLFGIQCLIAFGQERVYAMVQIAASLVFCAVLLLVDIHSAYGWAVVAAESVVFVLAGLQMRRVVLRAKGLL